jgi:hypothetical protein
VRSAVAGIALSCGVLCPAPAAASTIAVDVTGGTFRLCNPQPEPGCSVGWAFEVHSPITVVSLAVFDRGSDGLVESHDVGIFDGLGALLESTTIANGATPVASADPGGRWLFRSIDPLTLDPGTYVIAAFYLNQSSDSLRMNAPLIAIPEVTFLGGRAEFSVSALTFPMQGPFPGLEPSVFGPTFAIGTVPEPGSMLLVTAGLVAVMRRRGLRVIIREADRAARSYRRFRRRERTNRVPIPIPIRAVVTGSGTVRSIASASSRVTPEAPTSVT